MNEFIKKKIPFWIGVLALVMFSVPAAVLSLNSIQDGWRINANVISEPLVVYNYLNECYNARNNNPVGGAAYFIPTGATTAGGKAELEWTSFKSNADLPSTAVEVYPCALPNTECRVYYQYKIDNKIGQIKSTPWTDNSSTYQTGPYSLVKTGKDDHCNGSQGCGIRVGTQCSGDYGINVEYEMIFPDDGVRLSGGVQNTGFANTTTGAINWGPYSWRSYEDGDNECKSSGGSCEVKMTVSHNYTGDQSVTCDIGYQHRTDESTSGWRYNGASALANNNGSGDGENCENAGCGLQMRLRCEGPPAGTGTPPPASNGTTDGACGPADGLVYDGPTAGSNQPPVADRCQVGSASGYSYDGSTGEWNWTCTNSGVNSSCSAYNINYGLWNPPTDPGGGGACDPGEFICDTQIF